MGYLVNNKLKGKKRKAVVA